MVNRVTYTGDLGYEIWVAPEYLRRLYQEIMAAGRAHGIGNFGMRALLSMRLEKNFPTWYRELRPIYGAFEADLARFVDLGKNDFIGREAAQEERQSGGTLRRLTFTVDAHDADVLGDEPIWHDGKVVGWVTSGGFAHWASKSVAMGYVPTAARAATTTASRSRSSASASGRGRNANRSSTRRANGCAADYGGSGRDGHGGRLQGRAQEGVSQQRGRGQTAEERRSRTRRW